MYCQKCGELLEGREKFCPACGDSGYVDIKMCDCLRRELVLAGFRSSGLGALIERQSFDNFSLDYYKEDAATFAQMKRTFVILFLLAFSSASKTASGLSSTPMISRAPEAAQSPIVPVPE